MKTFEKRFRPRIRPPPFLNAPFRVFLAIRVVIKVPKNYHRHIGMWRSALIVVLWTLFSAHLFAAEQTTAVWNDGHSSALSDEELMRYALTSPAASYPEEAQQKKLTGSGVYELRINQAGATTSVAIVKSSGSRVLDTAATTAFRKWRFRPRTFRAVRIPVSWSVNRVQ
ncbi:MAG TPA: energy transducer TonB [Chthoniobacterales bacterium]|nr:energy transducer TonB [Chthoniobacterales bacterium]